VKTVTLKTAGFVLLAAGLIISALTYSWTNTMNAVPLSMPITLSPGHFKSPVFKTRATIQHVVSITFSRSLPPDQMDCFIGMNLGSNTCADRKSILNVRWQLISDHRATISGSSSSERGAAYSNVIERFIGRFNAQEGTEYTLAFDVLEDGSRLAPARPLLQVKPNLNGSEASLMAAGFAFYAGLACAAIGVIVVYRSIFGAKLL
jgi:hypothetical protein